MRNPFLDRDLSVPNYFGRLKIFLKNFQKSVDNRHDLWYNDYSKREEDTAMTDWYMNPENHDEDYEELLELLNEEEGWKAFLPREKKVLTSTGNYAIL